MGSIDLVNLILEKAGVALLPGSSFGKYGEQLSRLPFFLSRAVGRKSYRFYRIARLY